MKKITLNSTIDEIMACMPGSSGKFERLGIDFCCGGKATLAAACEDRGIDPASVLEALTHGTGHDAMSASGDRTDGMSPTDLADHIERIHHAKLWAELDRLGFVSDKVAKTHGEKDPRLVQLREVFREFADRLSEHMDREEKILFPLIRQIDAAGGPAPSHFGSVVNPIRAMEADHEEVAVALVEMRQLTEDFAAPAWACPTYVSLLEGLKELELDMDVHVREESELLFPNILKIETAT